MACAPSCPMAPAILISNASTDVANPSSQDGWNTKPYVSVSAFSGFTFGLPPAITLTAYGSVDPDCGSVTLPGPREESNRSDNVPARTSRERVALMRSSLLIDQSSPAFQAQT